MAVFVSLIPQLFSANVTTIIRFGKEAKDYISSIDKESRTEERKKERKTKMEREFSLIEHVEYGYRLLYIA